VLRRQQGNRFAESDAATGAYSALCVKRERGDRADKRVYKYPKGLYGAYKSAEVRTRKTYIPRRPKRDGSAFYAVLASSRRAERFVAWD